MKTEKKLEEFTKNKSLNILEIYSRKINFEILQLAQGKGIITNKLIDKYRISRMPLNRRINQLLDCGLVARKNKKRHILITPLGKSFLLFIEKLQKELKKHIEIKTIITLK